LVISSEFIRKIEFKVKRPIYIRNVNGLFNKEELIEYTLKSNIYYQKYKKKIDINVIRGQKRKVILGML